jgi:hypothetical protein
MATKQRSNSRGDVKLLPRPARAGQGNRSMPRPLLYLSALTGVLALAAAGAGLLWRGAQETLSVTTFLGQRVELYGGGLYEHDSLFVVGNNLGSDLVTVFLGLPLLAISLRLALRGSPRGQLLLVGTLGYFVYYGASYALGAVAYNEMFLVYVALFSATVFAFVWAFASIDLERLAISPNIPRRMIGIFMTASGIVTLGIWLMDPVGSLLTGDPPKRLDTHTTLFTHAIDIAIIVPAAMLAGALILKRRPSGYVVASSLLVLEALLMPMITIATIAQVRFGLPFAAGEIIGPIAGFSVFAILSIWVIVTILRNVSTPTQAAIGMDPVEPLTSSASGKPLATL